MNERIAAWTGKTNLAVIGILYVTKCPVSNAGGPKTMLTSNVDG